MWVVQERLGQGCDWSAALTSYCSTVFGSTSNTRATVRIPTPSTNVPTTHTSIWDTVACS